MERINFAADPEKYGARQVSIAQVQVDELLTKLFGDRFHPYWDNEFGAVFAFAHVFAPRNVVYRSEFDASSIETKPVILYAEGFTEKDWHEANLETWLKGKEEIDNSKIDFWFLMRKDVMPDPDFPNEISVWTWDKTKFYENAFDKAMESLTPIQGNVLYGGN